MKKRYSRYYLTLLFLVVNCIASAQFSDDFDDGDFTTNPTWSGQDANFIVNGSNELQLNAPAVSDTSYLSVAATDINNVTWDILVRMDFNPSSSNLCRVYIVSDNADLKGSLNGYFVQIGNTTDEISLYRQDGLAITEIIDGADDAVDLSVALARIRVTRDAAGNWQLLRDTLGGQNFFVEGSVLDATHTTTTHFGVFCKYTSTRSTLFFFDEIGNPYVDNSIPVLLTATPTSSTTLDVQFSESMETVSAETATNYSVDNGIGNPTLAVLDSGDPSLVHLTYSASFVNGTDYVLTANNVDDLGGNPIDSPSNANFTYFIADTPVDNDVIVTEFMADPSPVVGLPEVEYIELYNRSSKYFDLNGWTISDASSSATLPAYVLGPDEYVLITNTGDAAQFFVSNFVEVGMPSLNNSGDAIVLKDDLGTLIDSIYFTDAWYQDTDKENGGWAIERKHLNAPCNDVSNWSAAINLVGGTPAEQNSNYTNQDDTNPPFIAGFNVVSENEVELYFNELIDTALTPNVVYSPSINGATQQFLNENTLVIYPNTLQASVLYQIEISSVQDCWGNLMNTQIIQLGIPDSATSGDLILNEVMFNPLTNGSDYVELYNHSQKIIDISKLYFANWDDSIANIKSISTNQYLVLPGDYVLITEDTNDIKNDFSIYGLGTFVETDLPTYPNDSGTVYLLNEVNELLDYFHYDEDYHFDLLDSEDGKSLERISFDQPTNDPSNWHTAAETVEWGTPGYENSQQLTTSVNGTVTIEPKMFSPDSDGFQDVVSISLDLATVDNVIDIEVFDNRGRLIRLLEDNFFAGNQSTFFWDGINDDGEKAAIGTYIFLISVIDESGNSRQFKEVVVLAGKI